MANYFNLTLDNTAPKGVTLKINNGDARTSSSSLKLNIGCSDSNVNGYRMKIWYAVLYGNDLVYELKEEDANYESYSEEKILEVENSDRVFPLNIKVYVKVFDDMYNVSETVMSSIMYYGDRPIVDVTSSNSKITLLKEHMPILQKIFYTNAVAVFTVDRECDAVKIMLVNKGYDTESAETNILLPAREEQSGFATEVDGQLEKLPKGEYMSLENVSIKADKQYQLTVNVQDLMSVVGDDGCYCIKVFARDASTGKWSV